MKTSGMHFGTRFALAVMMTVVLVAGVGGSAWAATPYPMSSGPYYENFGDIPNWTDIFGAGAGASRWASVDLNATGTIPNGVKITAATTSFKTSTTGGVQRGSWTSTSGSEFNIPGTIALLATGASPENSSAVAIDLLLDFSGLNAGYMSFGWASVNNSTGNRPASLRVYWSTNGTTFTEIAGAAVLNVVNNTLTSGNVTVQLPSNLDNSSTARLRFYVHNGTGTGAETGSRPKIAIDNLYVTTAGNRAIAASATWGGTISPSGAVSVANGTNQTFTVTPSAGFVVRDVKVDNVSQGSISSYTFNNVTANHTISVTFAGLEAGWWPMNQSSGTSAPDATANANDATVQAGGTWGAGISGNALVLASASSQIGRAHV